MASVLKQIGDSLAKKVKHQAKSRCQIHLQRVIEEAIYQLGPDSSCRAGVSFSYRNATMLAHTAIGKEMYLEMGVGGQISLAQRRLAKKGKKGPQFSLVSDAWYSRYWSCVASIIANVSDLSERDALILMRLRERLKGDSAMRDMPVLTDSSVLFDYLAWSRLVHKPVGASLFVLNCSGVAMLKASTVHEITPADFPARLQPLFACPFTRNFMIRLAFMFLALKDKKGSAPRGLWADQTLYQNLPEKSFSLVDPASLSPTVC